MDLLVVHPFVASPSNKFVTAKWAWYDQDPQFFQAFVAAAPKNEIVGRSLDIMLEILTGKRAERGGGSMSMIGTQATQDAWAEVAKEKDGTLALGRDEEVYLLSEHRISNQAVYSKLPFQIQPNKGLSTVTDITCNFVVADDEEQSVYFYSHVLGAEYCGKKKPQYF